MSIWTTIRHILGSPQRTNASLRPTGAASSPLAPIAARVDDAPGWGSVRAPLMGAPGPLDRAWSERAADLDDAYNAWQKSFLVRRVVTLARSYIIGGGIAITSRRPEVAGFIDRFWRDERNHIDTRLAPMLNELLRAGEIFATLHTNRADGMSYLRFVPAAQIREIRTAANDYETELEYGQAQEMTAELRWWIGPGHRSAYRPARGGVLRPLMLHFCINREIGCTRGEGDLGPLLPWVKRYTAWLEDRVRLNRIRTRQGVLDVKIADDSQVDLKRHQLHRDNPLEAGIYVHGPGEEIRLHGLAIGAADAAEDGKILRLACGAAANVGLHYLGEGEAVNYATAKEMGEPTARYYAERQRDLVALLCDLVAAAYRRACILGTHEWPAGGDLQLVVSVTEVARASNESLSQSASQIVAALAQMSDRGWIDDSTAAGLAFQFAGEPLGAGEIAAILQRARREGERGGSNPNQEQEAPHGPR